MPWFGLAISPESSKVETVPVNYNLLFAETDGASYPSHLKTKL